jgi:hypothetical protein
MYIKTKKSELLLEDTRDTLVAKSRGVGVYKDTSRGKNRFERKKYSSVAKTVKQYNKIDMNKLFKEDILTVNVPIKGETDNYTVRITFGGFLEILRDSLQDGKEVDFRDISRAAIIGFNRDDVFIHCSCPDFKYRFNYYATRNNINSGTPETRPSKITNPHDSLGSACKHVLLVLNNTSWIIRVARVITNYIRYMQAHYDRLYADIIYPAVYGKEYEDDVQLSIDDMDNTDELSTDSDTDTLDVANAYNKDRTKFKVGNDKGIRFAPNPEKPNEDQLSIENEDDIL